MIHENMPIMMPVLLCEDLTIDSLCINVSSVRDGM